MALQRFKAMWHGGPITEEINLQDLTAEQVAQLLKDSLPTDQYKALCHLMAFEQVPAMTVGQAFRLVCQHRAPEEVPGQAQH